MKEEKESVNYEALLGEVDERLRTSCSKEQEQLFHLKLKEAGFSRRDFLRWTSMITAALMLPPIFEPRVAKAIEAIAPRPTVIWLHFAECTGCTESFIRNTNPDISKVIFDTVNLAFHDTLMMASGNRAEEALDSAIKNYKGKYILVVEGGIPTKDNGIYLRIGSNAETGIDRLKRVSKDAKYIVNFGTCSSFGGVQAAYPNPTGAKGVHDILGSEVVNVSGCPPNSVNMVGTLVHILLFDRVPPLDLSYRPIWAYGGRIHDNCERRAHFDAGEFVQEWGDEGAKKGWCLYMMGCKGPLTYNNCPRYRFNQSTNWPVGGGHGCIGCSEPDFWDTMAPFEEPNDKAGIRIPAFGGVEATSDVIGEIVTGITIGAVGVHAAGSIIRAKAEKKDKIEKNDSKKDNENTDNK